MSDPSVLSMNEAQWHFEYYALAAKERVSIERVLEFMKSGIRNLKEMLVSVLGLNVVKSWKALGVHDKEQLDKLEDETPFVPFSYLAAKPEMMKHFMNMNEKSLESASEHEEDEKRFSDFTKVLLSGGLDHVLNNSKKTTYEDTVEYQLEHQRVFGEPPPGKEPLTQKTIEDRKQEIANLYAQGTNGKLAVPKTVAGKLVGKV